MSEVGVYRIGQYSQPVRSCWCWAGLALLVCWGTFLVYYQLKFDLNVPPSTSGDEVEYDSLGWELAHGRGFSVNYLDEEFRHLYDVAAQRDARFSLPRIQGWVVTQRPPLYPLLISVTNRFLGRQFWGVRVCDAGMMAATLALIVMTVYIRFGWQAVPVAVGFFIAIDVRTRLYGRAILTEAMSLFLTTLLCFSFLILSELKADQRPRALRWSFLIGIIAGVSLLARSMMVLWIPGLILLLSWLLWSNGHSMRNILVTTMLFLLGLVLVVSPWAVRNIRVTGEFMPLGTQGQIQLSAAYGDAIWESGGLWVNIDQLGFFDEVLTSDQSHLEQELAKAKFSKQKAVRWILDHPGKTCLLVPMKIFQECRPRNWSEGVILLFALMGAFLLRKERFAQILIAIFAINLVGIAAMWSVEGRFLVPVLFSVHVLATAGLLFCLGRVLHLAGNSGRLNTP